MPSTPDDHRDDDTTLTGVLGREDAGKLGRLRLLVIGDGVCATHLLPDIGDLTIGRSEKADICIDDPIISRKHAVLHLGDRLEIEDLGSSNGLTVREIKVEPHQTVQIFPGDAIDLGSATLIVQRTATTVRPRRVWTHGAFEARLEDECARADRSGASFALVRVHVEGSLQAPAVQELLGAELRSIDVVANYGPDEYEVMLVDTPPERADEVVARFSARLTERGARIRVGIACYPRDGPSPEEIVSKANAAVRGPVLADEARGAAIVVQDSAMQRLHRLVQRIAVGMISVILLGETGVGKEVLADQLHRASPRAAKPFLRLNCAALTESLLESELFGHERGAFTGAIQAKPGLLETAQGGTVFLDEVGELPMSTQVKLLRVIEERQVLRVGAVKARPIDVRFIAATNRDLEAEVAFGSFRRDLFFRLNGISLVIPPLRERVGEIDSLARNFVAQCCRVQGRHPVPALSPDAVAILRRYSWPGNIRELRNVIERAVLLCYDGPITPEHLPVEKMGPVLPSHTPMRSAPPGASSRAMREGRLAVPGLYPGNRAPADENMGTPDTDPGWAPPSDLRPREHTSNRATMPPRSDPPDPLQDAAPVGLRSKVGAAERGRILEALERCAGNQTKAAKLLGMSRRTLVARLETYGLPRPRKASPDK